MRSRFASLMLGIGMFVTAFAVLIRAPVAVAATDIGWQGATPLSSWAEGDVATPEIFTDSSGTAWAAWRQSEGTRTNIMANSFVPSVGRWDVPTAVQDGPFDGHIPSICADGAGNAMAVWNTWDGEGWSVYWSLYTSGIGWSAGIDIDDSAAYNTDVPRISCNDAGIAVAVWTQYDGIQWSVYANTYRSGAGWFGARHIDPMTGVAAAPQVAVDPSGNAVAVWLEWNISKWRVASAWYQSGAGWWSRGFVEGNPGDAADVDLGIDSGGDAVAVWRQWDGIRENVWANRFDEGLPGWDSATLIETSDNPVYPNRPSVSVNATGGACAAWTQYDGTNWNTYVSFYDPVGDTWSLPIPLAMSGLDSFEPDAAIESSGRAYVVAKYYDPSDNHANLWLFVIGSDHTSWGMSYAESLSDDSLSPRLAMDQSDNVMLVWVQHSVSGKRYDLYSGCYNPSIGWITYNQKVEFDDEGWSAFPRLAVNLAGAAVAAWTRDDGPVSDAYATMYSPATGWSHTTLLERENKGDAIDAAAGIDDFGNAIVVWRQWDGSVFVIYASRYSSGSGWSVPRPLLTFTGDALPPQIAVNALGTAFVAWRTWDGVEKRLWAARFVPGTGWELPVLVASSVPNDILDPAIAIDDAGNAMMVDSIWDGGQYSVYAYRYVAGTGWDGGTLIENLPNHSFDHQVAMNRAGTAIASWKNLNGPDFSVYAALYSPGGGWAPPIALENSPGEVSLARVAIDEYSNAYAAWQQWDGVIWNAFVARYTLGPGWSSPMPLAQFTSTVTMPNIAVSPWGDAVVVFSQIDGRRTDIGYLYSAYAKRFTYPNGWGPTELLETEAGDAWAGEVKMDGTGNAMATFLQYDGERLNPWANRYVVRDGAPSLTILSPTTYLTNNPSILVDGLTDPGTAVSVDGIPVTVGTDGFFSFVTTLPQGYHGFVIVAKNLAGLTTTAVAEVFVDLSPPALSITSPLDGSLVRTPTVPVVGSTEALADLVVNGINVHPSASGNFLVNVSLTEGANMITATATDLAGNSKSLSLTVTLDTKAPMLVVTSPKGGITSNPMVTVSGQTEPGATVTINGTAVFVDPLGAFTLFPIVADGEHTFVIVATDAAGNAATETAQITVDSTVPALNVSSPVNGLLTRSPLVTVYGTTEPECYVMVNGVTTVPGPSGDFAVRLMLQEGLNSLQIFSIDPAGNQAALTLSVTVDTIPPVLAIASPRDGTLTNNPDILVSGYTDPGSNVTVDGVPVGVLPNGVFNLPVTLPEGQHFFNIDSRDAAGNVNHVAVFVEVDLTPPSLAIAMPAPFYQTTVPSVEVRGTTDPDATIVVNGQVAAVDASGVFDIVIALLTPGSNTIVVTAIDPAGNTIQQTRDVNYIAPDINGLQAQINYLLGVIDDLNRTIQDLKDNFNDANDSINQLQQDLNNANNMITTIQNLLNTLNASLGQTQGDIRTVKSDTAALGNVVMMGLVLLVVMMLVGIVGIYFALGRKIDSLKGPRDDLDEVEEEEEPKEKQRSRQEKKAEPKEEEIEEDEDADLK